MAVWSSVNFRSADVDWLTSNFQDTVSGFFIDLWTGLIETVLQALFFWFPGS